MSFTKIVSTVILVSSIATIFLFALIFWLYTNADTQGLILLKESLSTTSGFFGGITTLIAAYIASKLYNDWRIQHNANIELTYISEILTSLRNNLILMAPILNKLIMSGERYIHTDIVTKIEIDTKVLDEIYSNHKKSFLLFKEYNYIFLDDNNYLLFLRLLNITEDGLKTIFKIQSLENDIELLNFITQQLIRVPLPFEVKNGCVTVYKPEDILPIELYRQIEVNYINLVKNIAKNTLKK